MRQALVEVTRGLHWLSPESKRPIFMELNFGSGSSTVEPICGDQWRLCDAQGPFKPGWRPCALWRPLKQSAWTPAVDLLLSLNLCNSRRPQF